VHPALHHRRKPESGLRRHDGCSYSVTHRRTRPVPQLPCAMASICRCYAAHHAEIALSKTAAKTPCRLQSSIHHRIPRPAHHSHAPPRRQIAIDGKLSPGPRGFLPGRLSDAGPQRARIGHDWPASETLHHLGRFAAVVPKGSFGSRRAEGFPPRLPVNLYNQESHVLSAAMCAMSESR